MKQLFPDKEIIYLLTLVSLPQNQTLLDKAFYSTLEHISDGKTFVDIICIGTQGKEEELRIVEEDGIVTKERIESKNIIAAYFEFEKEIGKIKMDWEKEIKEYCSLDLEVPMDRIIEEGKKVRKRSDKAVHHILERAYPFLVNTEEERDIDNAGDTEWTDYNEEDEEGEGKDNEI